MSAAIVHKLDLSITDCLVCGRQLERDLVAEKEWCTHFECSAHGVRFSIPYHVPIGKEKTKSEPPKIRGLGTLRPIFAPDLDGHGVCRTCGQRKPWDAFRTNKTWSHGKASICKDCANIAKSKRRSRKREMEATQ